MNRLKNVILLLSALMVGTLQVFSATYDPALKAPACATPGAACDSGTLVNGRGTLSGGVETNRPNAISGACADGNSGRYHVDESIDRLVVRSTTSQNMTAGQSVTIEATVWAYSSFSSDKLDLYYAANANAPVWTFLKTVTPTKAGAQTLSASYILPSGTLQAVRAQFRWGGSASPCTSGSYNDRDDLVFAVATPGDTTPPVVNVTSPSNMSTVGGLVNVQANASDASGIAHVYFRIMHISGMELFESTDTVAPYEASWNTGDYPNGQYDIMASARDTLGNTASATSVVIVNNDATPPTVTMTAPANDATVSGQVSISAEAVDAQSGVNNVFFKVSFTPVSGPPQQVVFTSTDTAAPYAALWDATLAAPGLYEILARATDNAGNVAYNGNPTWVRVEEIDVTPPAVALTTPDAYTVVRDSVVISADASDTISGVDRVYFEVVSSWPTPGIVVFSSTDTTAPYSVTWDASTTVNGEYDLRAVAFDGKGNAGVSFEPPMGGRRITLDNDVYPPSVTLTAPAPYATVGGTVYIAAEAADAISGINRVYFEVVTDWPFPGIVVFSSTDTSAPYEVFWDASTSANGGYRINTLAFDNKGNMGISFDPPTGGRQITLDNSASSDEIPPTVDISSPTVEGGVFAFGPVAGTLMISGSASDEVQLAAVELRVDTGGYVSIPYGTQWSYMLDTTVLSMGAHQIQVRARDGSGNTAVDTLMIYVHNPEATYSPLYDTPYCGTAYAACSSGNLLDGRGTMSGRPEANQPNTLMSACMDGNSGTYHQDESIDRIVVRSLDGRAITAGQPVQIDVTVWAYSGYQSDHLDLYYNAAPSTSTEFPQAWMLLGTQTATRAGEQVISFTHTPTGSFTKHAYRAVFRFNGEASPSACGGGTYDDTDDLVFRSKALQDPVLTALTANEPGHVFAGWAQFEAFLPAREFPAQYVRFTIRQAGGDLVEVRDINFPMRDNVYVLNWGLPTGWPQGEYVLTVDVNGDQQEGSSTTSFSVFNNYPAMLEMVEPASSTGSVSGLVQVYVQRMLNIPLRSQTTFKVLDRTTFNTIHEETNTQAEGDIRFTWDTTGLPESVYGVMVEVRDMEGGISSTGRLVLVDHSASQ